MVHRGVRHWLNFVPLALVAWGLLLAASSAPCHAENDAAIKEFGVAKSKPLNTSFFFWNYKYVEAPYVVERRGLDSFVNGILVRPGPAWPKEDPTVKDDPGDPPAGSSPVDDGEIRGQGRMAHS